MDAATTPSIVGNVATTLAVVDHGRPSLPGEQAFDVPVETQLSGRG